MLRALDSSESITLAYQKVSINRLAYFHRIEFLDNKISPLQPFLIESKLLSKLIDKWIDYEINQEIAELHLNYENLADQDPFISSLIYSTEDKSMQNIHMHGFGGILV